VVRLPEDRVAVRLDPASPHRVGIPYRWWGRFGRSQRRVTIGMVFLPCSIPRRY
jgi:hypothetical protein